MKSWVLLSLIAAGGYAVYHFEFDQPKVDVSTELAAVHAIVVDEITLPSILDSGEPVLVEFGASWCGPCRMMGPALERIANENHDRLVVAKVDVDASPNLALRNGIQSVPTLILFKNGREVRRMMGYHTKEALAAKIAEELGERQPATNS